jgi:hypothetical protein
MTGFTDISSSTDWSEESEIMYSDFTTLLQKSLGAKRIYKEGRAPAHNPALYIIPVMQIFS